MQSELEKLVAEMVKLGVGKPVTPKKIIVSPTMLRAAEMILENNASKRHEVKVDFNE